MEDAILSPRRGLVVQSWTWSIDLHVERDGRKVRCRSHCEGPSIRGCGPDFGWASGVRKEEVEGREVSISGEENISLLQMLLLGSKPTLPTCLLHFN